MRDDDGDDDDSNSADVGDAADPISYLKTTQTNAFLESRSTVSR